jgi:alcohol dehydrogenase class IV
MARSDTFQFVHVTKIVAGPGSSDQAGAELRALGGTRAIIVTDHGIAASRLISKLEPGLAGAGIAYEVFDAIEPNPAASAVESAAEQARRGDADAVLAIGGGSPIDAGKMVAVLARFGGAVRDYEGIDTVPGPTLPLLAVPTTVGTGSEVTRGAVITDTERNVKMVVVSPHIFPRVAILDPLLLERLPPPITAATGMDSLTQALEGYVSRGANPISDALNLEALRLIAQNLRLAVARNDPDALGKMQVATTMQGIGFHNAGLGLVHAMSNTVGGMFGTAHGVTNAVILPHVMAFNVSADPVRFARVAEVMGEPIDSLSVRAAADRAIEAVRTLAADVGIPSTLGDLGVDATAIPEMARIAMTGIDGPTNPRHFTEEDIVVLYRRSFGLPDS